MTKVQDAIILLAGMGSRLAPLTENQHKALISIGGQTILERQVQLLAEQNVNRIHLVLGYRSEDIKNFVQKHFAGPTEFFFYENPNYHKTNTAYSLWQVLKKKQTSFLLLDGDVILTQKLLKILCAETHENLVLSDTDRSKLDAEAVRFRVNEHNHILEIGKHIPLEQSAGESIGVGLYQKDWAETLLKHLASIMKDSTHWQWYYEDVFEKLIQDKQAPSFLTIQSTLDEPWVEIDDHNDLKRAQELFSVHSERSSP